MELLHAVGRGESEDTSHCGLRDRAQGLIQCQGLHTWDTVCIMMLAEIMSKLPQPARTIEFISTGSEEGISDGMVQYSTLPTVRRK